MSKVLLMLFATAAFTFAAKAQSPVIQWEKPMGGSGNDEAYSIIQTTDGGYAVTGNSDSTSGEVSGNHGGTDYWLAKRNSAGAIEWQRSLGGDGYDWAYSVVQTTDGGFVIAGNSDSNNGDVSGNHGSSDYWVVKLNSSGAIEWSKSLGGSDVDQAYSVIQTLDGGYAVAGLSRSTDGDITANHGSNDIWVVKLKSNGDLDWEKSLGGTSTDEAYSIIQTADGGYALAGVSASTDGDVTGNHGLDWNVDAWLVKISSTGSLEWQKSLGGSDYDNAYGIIQTTDGGYAIAGQSSSTDGDLTANHGNRDYWVVKLSSTATIQWQKSYGGSGGDEATSIVQTADGGFAITGYSNSNDGDVTENHGLYDYWVVKLRSTGVIAWQKSLGGSGQDLAYSIAKTTDGGFAMAGKSYSIDGDVTGHHGSALHPEFWVVKLGEATATGIAETESSIALNVYPNPATSQLFIETNGAAVDQVNIYETNGSLVSQTKQVQNKTIDISQMASGVYIAEFKTGEVSIKRRLIKM